MHSDNVGAWQALDNRAGAVVYADGRCCLNTSAHKGG
jgi:hypothetical protein